MLALFRKVGTAGMLSIAGSFSFCGSWSMTAWTARGSCSWAADAWASGSVTVSGTGCLVALVSCRWTHGWSSIFSAVGLHTRARDDFPFHLNMPEIGSVHDCKEICSGLGMLCVQTDPSKAMPGSLGASSQV